LSPAGERVAGSWRAGQKSIGVAHNSAWRWPALGYNGARVTLAHMAQAWLRVADNCQDAKKVRPATQQQQQIQPKDDGKKD
jgi:hypothetical protein